jgi:hypothetical protein
MRRFFYLLLMLCLPLQGLAMQWGTAWPSDAAPVAHEVMHKVMHEVLHDAHVSHHHEDDGTLHIDDSDESAEHIQDHSAPPQPAALLSTVLPAAPPALVCSVQPGAPPLIPDPMLECPHRPPALSLG